MAQEPVYNLLQSIDPTKIKVPISERFSKLTLSSNKKQRQKEQRDLEEDEGDRQSMSVREKRVSASRNLLGQLSQQSSSPPVKSSNPLLRSESSKDQSDEKNSSHLQSNHYETMDPLNVTENDSDTDVQDLDDLERLTVEALSQKISALTMVSRPACLDQHRLHEVTQLVSTESQRSSMGEIVRPFHNIEEIPVRLYKKEVISLSSSSGCNSRQNEGNDYEMTEDEDDDEDEAITISDSSVSNGAEDDKGEMAMSTMNPVKEIREETIQLAALSPEKMERVAAFLRDVSIEQKNLKENGRFSMEDIEYNHNLSPEEIETLTKARKMATADTESMTPEAEDEDEATPLSLLERQRRLKALDDQKEDNARRLAHDETQDNSIMTDLQFSPSQRYDVANIDKTPQNNARRIVSAETQDNTILEDLEGNSAKPVVTPRNVEIDQKQARRLASADTEANTIVTEMQIISSHTPTRDNRRLALDETEESTQLHLSSANSSADKYNDRDKARRLAEFDTEINSSHSATSSPKRLVKNMAECETELNSSSSPVMKTPRKNLQDSYGSAHSLISNSSAEHLGNNSTPDHSVTILETDDDENENGKCDQHQSPLPTTSPKSNDNNKLSNSFHNEEEYDTTDDSDDSDPQMSQIQMSMAKINISAKINIKIHIPDSTETSEDNDSSDQRRSTNSNDRPQSGENISRSKQTPSKGGKATRKPTAPPNISPNNGNQSKQADDSIASSDKSSSIVEEDEKFVDEAQKLLNQLYGNSWQTPSVIRSLKKTSESGDKSIANKSKNVLSSAGKRNQKDKAPKEDKSKAKCKLVEESILGDFSMFRRNIVKTNLDSTRLAATPTMKSKPVSTKANCQTDPRNGRQQIRIEREKQIASPHTEIRKQRIQTPAAAKISAQQVRSQNDRWRQLIDSNTDSEGNNASDDDDADDSNDSDFEVSPQKTKGKANKKVVPTKKATVKKPIKYKDDPVDISDDDLHNSDVSWKKDSNSEDDYSDIEQNPRTRGGKPNRTKGRAKKKNANNSQDDLVYLDLSKEEVSIQEDVPESPPANHDVTFASRLDEILKTCRHEDKPKLPSSAQSTKTKRKLFTPMFGHDLESETGKVPEIVEKENRKIVLDENESLILDNLSCPFDPQGRPKKLDVINKQLTSVRQGEPIFPLTPSPKKPTTPMNIVNKQLESVKVGKSLLQVTPSPMKAPPATPSTTRQEKNNETPSSKTKTTTTSARKGAPKKMEELIRTPNYKYGFLKSLDVMVSKAFCHPDALYYRDNYRTKKEDLSTILYEMYNQKLFNNKLDVPITWNKKLSNTAGRCLNKKKFGVRSSVIELSDKVLTSADRLRCTLIHELCHAATWIFHGEGGHGRTWKDWANRANATFPEIPKIGVCHQYDIEYKYTYKCTLCGAKSHAHSKSKKVENIRCSYCHGAIEIFINKKDKEGNIMPTPVKEPTGFAKFVKDNYKKYKREDTKHADVMKILSNEFATMKLTKNGK